MLIYKKQSFLTLLLLLSFQLIQAASFDKYFTKLIRFEGEGFGIHRPIWGNKNFSKTEAYSIFKRHYWDKYQMNLFKSQEVAEVLIDHLINAGEGKASINIRAFEAIIGVKQDGVLSKDDISAANEFMLPVMIVNPFSNYRLMYYRSRENFSKYPGWITRAKSFMITDENGFYINDYIVLPNILSQSIAHQSTTQKSELLVLN